MCCDLGLAMGTRSVDERLDQGRYEFWRIGMHAVTCVSSNHKGGVELLGHFSLPVLPPGIDIGHREWLLAFGVCHAMPAPRALAITAAGAVGVGSFAMSLPTARQL